MLGDIRNSEAWKLISDISVGHWIITVIFPFIAGVASLLRGAPIEVVILIFLFALVLALAVSYYWRKNKELPPPEPQNKSKKKLAVPVQKKGPWRFVVAPLALVLLIIGHFLPVTAMQSAIKITEIQTHPDFLEGRQEPDGKRPIFNVFYHINGSRVIEASEITGVDYHGVPSDWAENPARGRYEDEKWEAMKSSEEPNRRGKLLPGKRMFFTVFQNGGAPPDMLQNIQTDRAAMYLMTSIVYRDLWGEHETDFCGYVWGDPSVFHLCVGHNTP